MESSFTVQIRTYNWLNCRWHWRKVAEKKKSQRMAIRFAWPRSWRGDWKFPLQILLTRISPGMGLDPEDNLPASMKSIRDQIATELGVNDRSADIKWSYAEQRGKWAVVVTIRPLAPVEHLTSH